MAGRITKIQRPDLSDHRNPDTGIFIVHKDLLWNPRTLFAEHDIAVRLIVDFRINLVSFRRRHVNPGSRILVQKIFKINVGPNVQLSQ